MDDFDKIFKNFEPKRMKDLFIENLFLIPPNQRVYSWNKDNWEILFEDFKDTYKSRLLSYTDPYHKFHFLGPMFFIPPNKKEGKLVVMDGQQRLLTLSIFFRVIFDILDDIRDAGMNSTSGSITLGKISSCLSFELERKSINRLKVNPRDKQIYNYLIASTDHPTRKIKYGVRGLNNSSKEILKCYKFFFNEIIIFFMKKKDVIIFLKKWMMRSLIN